jgi:hypothetical protein
MIKAPAVVVATYTKAPRLTTCAEQPENFFSVQTTYAETTTEQP